MVPSDYRLDEVCARLVPRLEASRRSFPDPRSAREAFTTIAREHVESALSEYREVVGTDRHYTRQAELLRRETLETFLPRYHALAMARNAAEADPSRLEAWSDPSRRLVLLALTLVCWMIGFRFVARPFAWLPLLVVSCAPIWPDLADWAARRQHRTALQAVVDDMQLIQDQATSYLPPEVLGVGEEHRPRRTDRNVE